MITILSLYHWWYGKVKTDGASIQEKQRAWDAVAKLFNVQPESNGQRSAKQLKKLWDNLKQKKRREVTTEKYQLLATGGGPNEEQPVNPVMELVDIAAPHVDVDVKCSWDSTAVFQNKNKQQQSILGIAIPSTSKTGDTSPPKTWTTSTTITTTPASGSSTPVGVSSKKRTRTGDLITPLMEPANDERYWRVLKLQEAVAQQRELSKTRLEAAKSEAEYAALKLKILKENHIITD